MQSFKLNFKHFIFINKIVLSFLKYFKLNSLFCFLSFYNLTMILIILKNTKLKKNHKVRIGLLQMLKFVFTDL